MSEVKFGMTAWDDLPETNFGNFTKDVYMKLDSGSNVVRCVTRPYQYHVHNFKEEGDTGFGEKIWCSKPAHGKCPICDLNDPNNKAKLRWYVGIIDRKTQTYKLLDIGRSIYDFILGLTRDESYGDPMKYDIDIKVNKKGGAVGYYMVIPKPPMPLSVDDVKIKEAVDTDNLQRKCTPPLPEKVAEKMEAARAKKGRPVKAAAEQSNHQPTHQEMSSSDEGDMTFPTVSA